MDTNTLCGTLQGGGAMCPHSRCFQRSVVVVEGLEVVRVEVVEVNVSGCSFSFVVPHLYRCRIDNLRDLTLSQTSLEGDGDGGGD